MRGTGFLPVHFRLPLPLLPCTSAVVFGGLCVRPGVNSEEEEEEEETIANTSPRVHRKPRGTLPHSKNKRSYLTSSKLYLTKFASPHVKFPEI